MSRFSNTTSESKLIGYLMNDINRLLKFPSLKVKYFTSLANKCIFKSLKKLYAEGLEEVDAIDVYSKATKFRDGQEVVDQSGGLEYLETLIEISEDDTFENAKYHYENIIECAFKNELRVKTSEFINEIDNAELSINEYEAKFEAIVLDTKKNFGAIKGVERLSEKIEKIEKILEQNRKSGLVGIPTFSELLNKYFTYLRDELVIIAAEAKKGKSLYVVNEVYRIGVLNNIPIAVFDTELNTDKFYTRLMARITGFSIKSIETGKYREYKNGELIYNQARRKLMKKPIFHQYDPEWTTDKIKSEAKRLRIQENLQILFYDYIKVPEVTATGVKEHDELGNLTITLKNLAGELHIPIVALAQCSPYKDNGFTLAGSRKIERYASTIAFLAPKTKKQIERDNQDLGGNYFIYVKFNRNGEQMESDEDVGVNIDFQKYRAKLEEASYQVLKENKELDVECEPYYQIENEIEEDDDI